MPDDEEDFTIHDPQHVLDGSPAPGGDPVPEGDSGILVSQPADPNLLNVTRQEECIIIGFNNVDVPDEVCIAGYRQQISELLAKHPECKVLTFDVTGIKLLPSGMLGLLASLNKRVQQIEVLNPSKDIQEALRVTRLNTLLNVRHS